VNRSKRLLLHFQEPPKVAVMVKPGALHEGIYYFFLLNSSSCATRRSSASCARMYWRTGDAIQVMLANKR
jgi:hypothetical protein